MTPYFLWDYELSDIDVHAILRDGEETERIWLASRILESARYEDVWKYLSLDELRGLFPKLKLKPQVRDAWAYALHVWNSQNHKGDTLCQT